MAKPRRRKTYAVVSKRVRVYRVITVKRKVMQCERPYVLFGEAVRDARISRGLTQQALADTLGRSRASIANIEVGRQRVLLGDVFTFAKALKVYPMQLFNAVQR